MRYINPRTLFFVLHDSIDRAMHSVARQKCGTRAQRMSIKRYQGRGVSCIGLYILLFSQWLIDFV